MGRLFAAIAVAAVLVSSALAQSTDMSVGSGNIAPGRGQRTQCVCLP
jgi:hypothetical protein